MAAHGFPRATADLDIFIRPNIHNAKKVYKALVEFGAPMDSVTIEDFSKLAQFFK